MSDYLIRCRSRKNILFGFITFCFIAAFSILVVIPATLMDPTPENILAAIVFDGLLVTVLGFDFVNSLFFHEISITEHGLSYKKGLLPRKEFGWHEIHGIRNERLVGWGWWYLIRIMLKEYPKRKRYYLTWPGFEPRELRIAFNITLAFRRAKGFKTRDNIGWTIKDEKKVQRILARYRVE